MDGATYSSFLLLSVSGPHVIIARTMPFQGVDVSIQIWSAIHKLKLLFVANQTLLFRKCAAASSRLTVSTWSVKENSNCNEKRGSEMMKSVANLSLTCDYQKVQRTLIHALRSSTALSFLRCKDQPRPPHCQCQCSGTLLHTLRKSWRVSRNQTKPIGTISTPPSGRLTTRTMSSSPAEGMVIVPAISQQLTGAMDSVQLGE